MLRIISILLALLMISNPYSSAFNNDDKVTISLGNNLTEQQEKEILNLFEATESTRIIKITNEEERKYLGKYVDNNLIGSKALSCAYVKELETGSGISVETYNINWVTEEMYMNALVTAGVRDAEVRVAAPINVSGTAALTGIIKAFEGVKGINISEEEKDAANEELAKTGRLGDEIGKEKASQLIDEIKREIIDKNLKDENQIREIVIRIAGDLNINLNSNQINEIVGLMKKIASLDLNSNEIENQLKGISSKLNEIAKENKEVKSILQKILDYIKSIIESLFSWITP